MLQQTLCVCVLLEMMVVVVLVIAAQSAILHVRLKNSENFIQFMQMQKWIESHFLDILHLNAIHYSV